MPPAAVAGETGAMVGGLAGGGRVVLRGGAGGRHYGAAVGGIGLGRGGDVVGVGAVLLELSAGSQHWFDQVVDDVIVGDFDEVEAVPDVVDMLAGQGETMSFGR